jgi:hypothetical protein
MKNALIAICVASFWLAVLVLLLYRAGSPVLVAAVLVVAGTTALGALAVCDALAVLGVSNRIAIDEGIALTAKSRR